MCINSINQKLIIMQSNLEITARSSIIYRNTHTLGENPSLKNPEVVTNSK